MIKIKKILAREILDSRGNPTVEAEVILTNDLSAKASIPSGASTGRYEAWELRDGNPRRYHGLGVLRAVKNVNRIIAPRLIGHDILDIKGIDRLLIALDGTENKKKLGANAILAVSLVCARAGALSLNLPLYRYLAKTYNFSKPGLPTPSFNIINGGLHASTNMDFQEFMILPLRKSSFTEKLRLGAEVFHELGKVLREQKMDTDLGNEGGYAPEFKKREQAIELILAAIKRAGYRSGKDVALGLDVGSSRFYDEKQQKYHLPLDRKVFSGKQLIGLYRSWIKKYPIVSIEDGLAENDWSGWSQMTKELGKKTMLIGDDLFVTNINRLEQGIEKKAANAVLIKVNQIGTLTETVETIKLARRHGYRLMISHRSGETNDDFIADLAVACRADYIKSGSVARGERLAKYNRLTEIEAEL